MDRFVKNPLVQTDTKQHRLRQIKLSRIALNAFVLTKKFLAVFNFRTSIFANYPPQCSHLSNDNYGTSLNKMTGVKIALCRPTLFAGFNRSIHRSANRVQ